MKFDVILTNPPFQDTTRRGKTPHKLWIDFTRAVFDRLLADGGVLCQVSPSSFRSPNSIVLDLMKRHRTTVLRFDTGKHFPLVGSTFADYAIWKEPNDGSKTIVVVDGRRMPIVLDDEVFYLPNDLTELGMSIHRKVMFHPKEKLAVKWDYVTCHNIRMKDPDPTLSRTRTDKHVNKVFHTNAQCWWTSLLQDFAPRRKVMWTRSGYTKPFYDPGTMGGTDMVYYVLVESDEEGRALAHNLNLALMRYIYKTAKWSGFGNERVFAALPDLPRDRKLTDADLFALFSLTPAEVAHVRRVTASSPTPTSSPCSRSRLRRLRMSESLWAEVARRMDEHGYMRGVERTVDRVQATGEVFTPTALVVEMVQGLPLDTFAAGKTILDPACGDGQFLVAAKWIKILMHGMSESAALADLYGIDIMRDNVDLCRRRLGGGTIVMGNTLDPFAVLEGQTDEERSLMLSLFADGPFARPVKKGLFDARKPRQRRLPVAELLDLGLTTSQL